VWTQAGSGLIHEELPADSNRELHAVQIFVNLSSRNKLAPPKMIRLQKNDVPGWRSDAGDRVRVLVGSFERVSAPLVPAEPFNLLDVELQREIAFPLKNGYNALVYVLKGEIIVRAEGREQKVTGGHAMALHGTGGRAKFEASHPAHFLILSGAEIQGPVVTHGPFIMNDASQIKDALARYHAGRMGQLEAFSEI